ncbi:MAG: SOS response-associated peptidase [Gammaproteobacteria bacterium]|nr:SOS response-associated peptidase [Gammaproteobacteria bacterium]NND53974.1 SOS response-associated peptidase [Gammaproteobacteria bacterium]
MCGRFAFFSPAEAITAAFGFGAPHVFTPRYNIAPTQQVLTIVSDESGRPLWKQQQWGLVPFWAKDQAIGNRMINARAETIAEKPSYRQSFSRRRCLVPASGFYEWSKGDDDKKTPVFISRADEAPLLMAGIWDVWEKGEGDPLHSFSIVTREANDFMRDLHHRMPVILEPAAMDDWFDPAADKEALLQKVNAEVAIELQAWPVSRRVNSPLNDAPELVEPVG